MENASLGRHVHHLTECAGNPEAATRTAEDRKHYRYDALSLEHEFIRLAILDPAFEEFVRDLGRCIKKNGTA